MCSSDLRKNPPSAVFNSHNVKGIPARYKKAAAEAMEKAAAKKAEAKKFRGSPARGTLPKVWAA